MYIVKLPWLGHKGEHKSVECYSVTINRDGTRLASGGLDGNVKIWDTSTILPFAQLAESDGQRKSKRNKVEETPEALEKRLTSSHALPPSDLRRPMCSVSRHNGVVTSVKFSPDGRFLASGSDDKICLIWEKDLEKGQRPQFGGDEDDLEHWTVRKRLVAHDNDIQDIAWSPDGALLVTVGLDRSIIVWNANTFERIKRYDIHQSMVKGVVFDPANKFFATASDDRTVRVFRYYRKLNENSFEFQMEHIVIDPFKKSPLTSYFRRMSWSPDGQHIAVPNATNGPVPSVAVINRGDWAADISLIGHEMPCEVAAFAPVVFNATPKESQPTFSTVVATGGQDRTVAFWSTTSTRPLAVTEDIVHSSITDMAWAPDGSALYFSSLDGSITCVKFEPGELGVAVPPETVTEQLNRYGADRDSAVFPESIEQLRLEGKADTSVAPVPKAETPIPSETVTKVAARASVAKPTAPLNAVTTTKSGKKRVAPTLVSAAPSTPTTLAPLSSKTATSSALSTPNYILPRLGVATAVHGIRSRHTVPQLETQTGDDNDNVDMAINDTPQLSEATLKRQRRERKRVHMELRYPSGFKRVSNLPTSMFNNHQVLSHDVGTILAGMSNSAAPEVTTPTVDIDEDLGFAVVVESVSHKLEGESVVSTVEVRNGQPWTKYDDDSELQDNDTIDFNSPTRVIVSTTAASTREFTLYYPQRLQHAIPIVIDDTFRFIVLVSLAGTVWITTTNGTSVVPSFELGGNVVVRRTRGKHLLLITNTGLVYTYEFGPFGVRARLREVSLAPVLNQSTETVLPLVKAVDLGPDGSVYVILDDTGDIHRYDSDLGCWTMVMDAWYYSAVAAKGNENDLLTTSRAVRDAQVKRHNKIHYKFTDATTPLEESMVNRYQESLEYLA
ncbi:protein Hir1p [Diutina catenulata]